VNEISKENVALIRLPQVRELTGLSRSTIYLLESRGEFPKHVALSVRASAWVSSEVQDWIRARIRESRGEAA
jgi:prophage regulatory protein